MLFYSKGAGFQDLVADLEGSTTPKFALYAADVQLGDQTEKKLLLIDW